MFALSTQGFGQTPDHSSAHSPNSRGGEPPLTHRASCHRRAGFENETPNRFKSLASIASSGRGAEVINIMKPKRIFINILAVLFGFPLMGYAQQAPNSGSLIQVITTFDYPGTGNLTLPQKINDPGDVVGSYIDSLGVARGFVRFSNGTFSAPIVDPNDTVGFTEGRGINNSRTVVGDYATADANNHGFFLSGGTFTEYDIPGALSTDVFGINDFGDFTGTVSFDDVTQQAFVSVGGTVTSFSVPAAIATLAYQINNSNRLVVGYYVDASGILHGYYRDANGALHFTIDPPGS